MCSVQTGHHTIDQVTGQCHKRLSSITVESETCQTLFSLQWLTLRTCYSNCCFVSTMLQMTRLNGKCLCHPVQYKIKRNWQLWTSEQNITDKRVQSVMRGFFHRLTKCNRSRCNSHHLSSNATHWWQTLDWRTRTHWRHPGRDSSRTTYRSETAEQLHRWTDGQNCWRLLDFSENTARFHLYARHFHCHYNKPAIMNYWHNNDSTEMHCYNTE